VSAPSIGGGAPRRLRVVLVSPGLGRGGAERQMLTLASALPRDDVEPRFIVMAARGPLADEAEALGIRVDSLGLDQVACRRPGLGCARALARAMRRYVRLTREADIVDAWLVPAIIFVGLAQVFARVPTFVAGRRSLAAIARPRSLPRRLAAAFAMRRADAFVANSQAAADELVAIDGVDASRVHVIRNAITPAARPDDRDRTRAAWGFGPQDIVVGCVANYNPGKGLLELLEVAVAVHRLEPRIRFVLVGDGELRDTLRRRADELAVGDVVRLAPGRVDARSLYSAFDLAVQASESESFPNAVLEAAAAGLPIIATDVGGTGEIIADGESGILTTPGDTDALTARIAELAGDPEARRRLGAAAARRASAFTPDVLAASTLDLYRSLAERKKTRGR
jgi:L-malate glycosyltransferase